MDCNQLIENMHTKDDFINFLKYLKEDYNKNRHEWVNKNIDIYLESIASWADDMEGYYQNMNIETPQNINWNFIATLYYVGKIYE